MLVTALEEACYGKMNRSEKRRMMLDVVWDGEEKIIRYIKRKEHALNRVNEKMPMDEKCEHLVDGTSINPELLLHLQRTLREHPCDWDRLVEELVAEGKKRSKPEKAIQVTAVDTYRPRNEDDRSKYRPRKLKTENLPDARYERTECPFPPRDRFTEDDRRRPQSKFRRDEGRRTDDFRPLRNPPMDTRCYNCDGIGHFGNQCLSFDRRSQMNRKRSYSARDDFGGKNFERDGLDASFNGNDNKRARYYLDVNLSGSGSEMKCFQ